LFLATCASLASAQGYNAVFSRDGVDVWAVGDAGRVGRSVDSGASFTTTTLGAVSLRDVAARGFTALLVGDGGVVWRSTNSGGSWTSATLGAGDDLNAVAFPADDAAYVAGKNGGIWKSTDGGANWVAQTSGTAQHLNALRFRDALNGWAAGNAGTVLKTTDGGANWTPVPITTARDLLSVDAIGNDVWAVGTHSVAWNSADAGGVWTPLDLKIDSKGDVTAVWMESATQITLTGGGGFIRTTTDGGATWSFATHPLMAATSDYFGAPGGKAWAVTKKNNAVVRTSNGGTSWALNTGTSTAYSWVLKQSAGAATIRGMSFHTVPTQNRDRVFAMMGGQVYKSFNRGETWQAVGNSSGANRCYSFYCNPKDSMMWVAAAKGTGHVYRTTNGGTNWSTTISIGFTEYGMPLEMNPDKTDTLYFMPEDGTVRASYNFGSTWTQIANPGFRSPCDIIISPDNNANVLVGDGVTSSPDPAIIFQSENGGTAFTQRYTSASSETPSLATSRLAPNVVFTTNWSSGGVYRSTDYGKNWSQVATTSSAWGSSVAPDDPKMVVYNRYAGTPNYLSTDGGSTFASINLTNPGSGYALYALDRSTILDMHSNGIYKLNVAYTVPSAAGQAVAVTSPNGGESWPMGEVRTITWTATSVPLVRLEYQRSPSDPWVFIADVEGYAQSYAWTVPYEPTSTAKVRVTDISDGAPVDLSNANVSITGPVIHVAESSLDFGTHAVGSSTTLPVTITNNGNAPLTISAITAAGGSYTAGRPAGFVLGAGLSDTTGVTFVPGAPGSFPDTLTVTSDGGAPSKIALTGVGEAVEAIAVLLPNGGEAWQAGYVHDIQWSAAGIADVALDYRASDTDPWVEIAASLPAAPASFSWTAPFSPTNTARIRVRKVGGALEDDSDNVFAITYSEFDANPAPFDYSSPTPPGVEINEAINVQN
jgi:photosystem II stability/assembly factor-like uncharacterized protein